MYRSALACGRGALRQHESPAAPSPSGRELSMLTTQQDWTDEHMVDIDTIFGKR